MDKVVCGQSQHQTFTQVLQVPLNYFSLPFQGFFDEVEDLKFALQQSARLNKEYEKTLRKLCQQFGVPYPHPEQILDTS